MAAHQPGNTSEVREQRSGPFRGERPRAQEVSVWAAARGAAERAAAQPRDSLFPECRHRGGQMT
eukprot:1741772-Heterocapsa_arctica.AAC.1